MAIQQYLAMTAAEFAAHRHPKFPAAWMACHFSPYEASLTNLPQDLPKGSLLILNDRIPPMQHDPVQIAQSILQIVDYQKCSAVLLDFQRKGCKNTFAIAKEVATLPCPVAVSQTYGMDLNCPIFLPPVPLLTNVRDYLQPYRGREIWLELALDGIQMQFTEKGCTSTPLPNSMVRFPFQDTDLHCHYQSHVEPKKITFSLRRTADDLASLLAAAEEFGVTTGVGLWQELN